MRSTNNKISCARAAPESMFQGGMAGRSVNDLANLRSSLVGSLVCLLWWQSRLEGRLCWLCRSEAGILFDSGDVMQSSASRDLHAKPICQQDRFLVLVHIVMLCFQYKSLIQKFKLEFLISTNEEELRPEDSNKICITTPNCQSDKSRKGWKWFSNSHASAA